MSLPEHINAIRTFTYSTDNFIDDVAMSNEISKDEVTTDMLTDWIKDWVAEDMSSPLSRHDIVFQDENGGEL